MTCLVLPVFKESLVHKALKAPKELKALKANKESKALRVRLV